MESPPVPKNIILIGFMGSGKSSVGRIIAPQLNFVAADTDHLVIQNTGLQITEIFKNHGEEYFRDQETAALESLREHSGLVVSTGGGIVLRPGNIALLRELGFIAWLTASEEILFDRVSRSNKRPLMHTSNPRETIHNLLVEREPLYASAAHFTVDTTNKTHEEVAGAIIFRRRGGRFDVKSRMIKVALAAHANTLGFDICRVAKCGPPPHSREFEAWLGNGHAGDMAWLERNKERRVDPQRVLPGARSIVVLGMNYFQGNGGNDEKGPSIARYAWGDDYHEIIEKKLRALDEFLSGHGGVQKCYVDTGPVLERDFAAVAGAGWHGKSTMLINRKLGTWFFLAEILTTLELEADAPERDHCGSCTRCIDACPTAAITAPYQLDARRCISYLTIELKGSIPVEFRPMIGDRIYGCDDCLAACPWNRFARQSSETAFAMRDTVAGMSLRDFLNLTDEQFRLLFRKSPIKRIKRRGILRNVCVALGNTGSPRDIPALEKAALDPEPLICEHAHWAIERILQRHEMTTISK